MKITNRYDMYKLDLVTRKKGKGKKMGQRAGSMPDLAIEDTEEQVLAES